MLTFLTQKCIEEAFDATDHLPFGEKMSIKEEYVYLIEHSRLRVEYFLEIVSMYLSESVVKLAEKKDFRGSLRYLHECYRPIEEAAKAGRDLEGALDDVEETREDVRLSTCTAESLQAIAIGDKIYEDYNLSKKGSKDDSAAEVMIWEVIDWYKQAVVLTRESDIEVEAMAFSRLGRVYYHALDMESKARENFTKALQLSLSLFPRTFTSDAWFKECNETLEKIQKGQVRQENEKWNEERQQYLVELEDELKDLNSKDSALSDMKFLEYLYKTYPPLDERHKLIEKDLPTTKMGDQEYKKAKNAVLRKAILHYHPDRCDVKEHGEKRKVFNEEITKMLTSKYEHTK